MQAESRVPHGPQIEDMAQLKTHLLAARKHDIAENVVRRLLTYGIGRPLNYRDRYDVEDILAQSSGQGFLFQDIIVLICQSDTFRGATNNKAKRNQK